MKIEKRIVSEDPKVSLAKKAALAAAMGVTAISLTSCGDTKNDREHEVVGLVVMEENLTPDDTNKSVDSSAAKTDSATKIWVKDSLALKLMSVAPTAGHVAATSSDDSKKLTTMKEVATPSSGDSVDYQEWATGGMIFVDDQEEDSLRKVDSLRRVDSLMIDSINRANK